MALKALDKPRPPSDLSIDTRGDDLAGDAPNLDLNQIPAWEMRRSPHGRHQLPCEWS